MRTHVLSLTAGALVASAVFLAAPPPDAYG